jgi:hypothetical protein
VIIRFVKADYGANAPASARLAIDFSVKSLKLMVVMNTGRYGYRPVGVFIKQCGFCHTGQTFRMS